MEELEWHPEADAQLARHLRTGRPYARPAFCAVVSLWIVAIAIAIYQHTRLVNRKPQSCRSPPATGSKVRVRSDLPWLLGLLKRVSPTRSVISMKVGHRMSDQVERTLPNPSAVASTGMSCTTPGDDSMYIIDILYNLLIIQRNISWDGWPTKCLSKYLFSPAIDFPVFATSCPVGQLWRTAFRLSVLGARKNGPGNCVSSLGRRFNRHRRNSTCLWRQDSILSSAVMNSGQPVTRRQRGFHRIWRKLAGAGWQFTSASRVRRSLQPPPSGASAA